MERIKYWVAVGAQPSDTVARLLGHAGLLPRLPYRFTPQKRVPRSEREFSTAAWSSAPHGAPASADGAMASGTAAEVDATRGAAHALANEMGRQDLRRTVWGASPGTALALAAAGRRAGLLA